jgi:pSer/pThr/pTyr-binding forkhead associated (FHA) protein
VQAGLGSPANREPSPYVSGIIDRVTSTDPERMARVAYEAHRGANPGSLPRWEDATMAEQQAWRAAVSAITEQGEATLTEGLPAQSLVVQAGDQTYVFHSDFTAGRQGTLPISDERASSHHALFQFAHGLWYVEDLKSTNGTWLNERRIFAAQRLRKADKVRIGRTIVTVVSS